jgi:hypothetical protein
MSTVEETLKDEFFSALERRDATTVVSDAVREALLQVIGRDQMTSVVQDIQQKATSLREERELTLPQIAEQPQRIFLASIGATVGVPFNYQWTWSTGTGSPSLSAAADRTTGRMSFSLFGSFSNSSSGAGAAALGIYFRPMVTNGILRLSANPGFTYRWGTFCAFCSAHSDGWIGLYGGRYNLSGGFDGDLINQQISLWNDNSWWYGVGSQTGSNTAFPLFAQANVDSSHWYALWVWCGGGISACGFGSPFWGSNAGASMSVTLPSMTWELF